MLKWEHRPLKCITSNGKQEYAPFYFRWRAMRSRCHFNSHPESKRYKDRGIKVCKEWQEFWNFYDWCIKMSKNNTVLISEYDMPKDKFVPIWSIELKTTLGSGVNVNSDRNRIEKLFMVKGDL